MLMTLEEINEGVIYVDGQPLTDTGRGADFSYFVSNTVLLTENGGKILTSETPQEFQIC